MDKINLAEIGAAHGVPEKEKTANDESATQPVDPSKTDTENPAQDASLETFVDAGQLPATLRSDQAGIVDWDSPQDPSNPQNWTGARKWMIIILVSAITFNQLCCTQSW